VRLVSLGEILWDIIDGRELLGGATFNFSVQLSRLGHDVAFLSAVGDDDRGRRALEEVSRLGLSTRLIRTARDAPTGWVPVAKDAAGEVSYVIKRPAAYDFTWLDEDDWPALDPQWIYHGTLTFMEPRMRALLNELIGRCPQAKLFYDINLRRDSYTPPLVMELLRSANVVKMNHEEVAVVQQIVGTHHASLELFCRDYASRFHWDAICVTLGERGCAILHRGEYAEVEGNPVQVADTVGAGDAFAAAFLHGLDAGWPVGKIGAFANRLGSIVASREGGVPDWSLAELE
jgi:fructokinase